MRTSFPWRLVATLGIVLNIAAPSQAAAPRGTPFGIQVVDEQTGRGVPLVELETTSKLRFVTDSGGYAAIDAPELLNQKVHFRVSSFGYEFPADGFGMRGTAVDVKPGQLETLKIKRLNIAERMYRITGAGIYADTVKLGRKAPIKHPLLNAQVTGQDSIQSIVYRDTIYLFWGDTGKLSYPLGLFEMAGATIDPPGRGGLDPAVGLNLKYFTGQDGFARPMAPYPDPGLMWLDGFVTLKDDKGQERMLAHASLMESLTKRLRRMLVVFNDETKVFDELKVIDLDAILAPGGHPFRASTDGTEYYYFPTPYPSVRVPATWSAFTDPAQYEGLSPLKQGARYTKDNTELDRDPSGRLRMDWKKNTPPLTPRELEDLIAAGALKREELPHRLVDVDTNKPIVLHGSSVAWNEYRKKWIMIGLQLGGDSMLGEIYFAESAKPEGPWEQAKKVATHAMRTSNEQGERSQGMDLYNPKHHPFLDQENGKLIYFEGTYTNSFSGNPMQTPRYEYNQLMYRLDLSDDRLKPVK